MSVLQLEQNLALMAGAGTGKTHSLVTLCLHLLVGARAGREPLPPRKLCLVTFTQKAAGELRHRLRQRVARLTVGSLRELEPDLAESCVKLGLAAPTTAQWRAVAEGLDGAFVGTFHALAMQLLRRGSVEEGGMEPGFLLLDEDESARCIEDVAERVVLDALNRGEPGAVALCQEVEFGEADARAGLLGQLVRIYSRLRDDGRDAGSVQTTDGEALRAEFDTGLCRARSLAAEVIRLDVQERRGFGEPLQGLQAAVAALQWESFFEQRGHFVAALQREPRMLKVRKEFGEALKGLRDLVLGSKEQCGLSGYRAAAELLPHEVAFRALLAAIQGEHRAALDRRAALDFAGLLIRARDLLRDSPTARMETQARFGALLVDEFQDTNELQWELVCLLAERRDGAARPPSTLPSGPPLPLEPGFLCIVGDVKQSIYEFRGADVSLFERAAAQLESEGGVRAHLQDNRRSRPQLLEFFNPAFASLMGTSEGRRLYEVSYTPASDDLRATRRPAVAEACVERLCIDVSGKSAAECREAEADTLAQRIALLLAPDAPGFVEDGAGLRPVRPGEVAVLFARLTHVEVFRQALLRHGVPNRVVRGRGFYGAQEIVDITGLLGVMVDVEDSTALAGVLRSPWVGLTDASLMRLMLNAGGVFSFAGVVQPKDITHPLPEEEAHRLRDFLGWFEPLRLKHGRLPLPVVLAQALAAGEYRTAVAAGPFGEQALANIDKLLTFAQRWQDEGRGDARQFSERVRTLSERDARESQAELSDAAELGLVQLLTIHQAKGLQWPVVCAADLGAEGQGGSPDLFIYDRSLGLAMRPSSERGRSPRIQSLSEELARRAAAESMRLLYVALTRTQDLLILSGQPSRRRNTWREQLDALISLPALRPRVLDVPMAPGAPKINIAPPLDVAELAERDRALAEAVQRVRQGPPPLKAPFALSIHGLEAFARLQRGAEPQVELEQHSDFGEALEWRLPLTHPALRTAQVHRALARLDYKLAGAEPQRRERHVRTLVEEVGLFASSAGAKSLTALLGAFLASAFAARVRDAEPAGVLRDVPYAVDSGAGVLLTGRMDLLFCEKERALAVDFCLAPPSADAGYGLRAEANQIAALLWLDKDIPVETGIVFLASPEPELSLLPWHSSGGLRETASSYVAHGREKGDRLLFPTCHGETRREK